MKMLRAIGIVLSCGLLLSACTNIEVLDDGRVKGVWDSPGYPGKKVVYIGSWEQGKPVGAGKFESPNGFSCSGEFLFQTPNDRLNSPVIQKARKLSSSLSGDMYYRMISWGKGEVFYEGKLFYQGMFYSWLWDDWASSVCIPDGQGTAFIHYSDGVVKVTGTFEEGEILTIGNGPCNIEAPNHMVFAGNCSDKNKGLPPQNKKLVIGANPFVFADIGEGTIIFPDGTKLEGYFYKSGAVADGLFTIKRNGKLPEEIVFENNQQITPSPEQLAFLRAREAERKMNERVAKMQQDLQRQAELQRQQQGSKESDSSFQWGKMMALGAGAAIGGINKLPSEVQAKAVAGMVQDSMGGQQGMNNTNNALASSVPVSNSSTANSDPNAAAKACQNDYSGPNNDPQVDSYCKMAAFDACLHRATGQATYDSEGRNACQTLNGLLQATGGKSSCKYCPYPY